jgi:hypothetical protein
MEPQNTQNTRLETILVGSKAAMTTMGVGIKRIVRAL